MLRAHHVQQVVEYVTDLLHLHLCLAVCCLVLVAAVWVVHQVALLHACHLLHEVFHEELLFEKDFVVVCRLQL